MNQSTLFRSLLGLGLLLSASAAFAATPVGLWEIRSYRESGLNFGTVNQVCYLTNGTWYSLSFPGANGEWFQKGDRIRSTAFSPQNGWNHALFGQFASNTLFTGEYIGFLNNPATQHPDTTEKGNFTAAFISRICPPNPAP
ncbi:hypothetical protein SAMN02949497_3880 [Methylomagnum ishizawai]|uniref:Uncharacterized protein n=1 Tax=Methylomagnum ishizawai TaxID=1760988 RepID=A0A1Y6D253_9GAMM|nr:hypothetical protein [Methylomagnum ishizawai]SMF96480.1 hypothetical protein SAMN02949497_3880 [Methylomagnum ishizawai]